MQQHSRGTCRNPSILEVLLIHIREYNTIQLIRPRKSYVQLSLFKADQQRGKKVIDASWLRLKNENLLFQGSRIIKLMILESLIDHHVFVGDAFFLHFSIPTRVQKTSSSDQLIISLNRPYNGIKYTPRILKARSEIHVYARYYHRIALKWIYN